MHVSESPTISFGLPPVIVLYASFHLAFTYSEITYGKKSGFSCFMSTLVGPGGRPNRAVGGGPGRAKAEYLFTEFGQANYQPLTFTSSTESSNAYMWWDHKLVDDSLSRSSMGGRLRMEWYKYFDLAVLISLCRFISDTVRKSKINISFLY